MRYKKPDIDIKDQDFQQRKTIIINKKRLLMLAKYLKWYGITFGVVFVVTLIISYVFSSQLANLRIQFQNDIITLDDFVNALISYSLAVAGIFASFEILLAVQGFLIYKNSSDTISHAETLRLGVAIIVIGHLVKAAWNIAVAGYLYILPVQLLKQNIQNAINAGRNITAEMIYPSELLTLNSFIGFIGLIGYVLFALAFQRLAKDRIEFKQINVNLLLILLGGAILSVPEFALFGDILLGFGFLNLAKNIEHIITSSPKKQRFT
ncbi:MAG: hypothetical protein J7L47_08355 [Candidatus Odinarchaeota archaeon]|nr:hypothetical protein [Candidatus Odinarchaeota archaeon]